MTEGSGNMNRQATCFKAYITKYALTTTGIQLVEVEHCSETDDKLVKTTDRLPSYHHAPAWHRTKAEAIAEVEAMRARKLKSLRKSIVKLEAMKFEL